MYKCLRCNRYSDDGKWWYSTTKEDKGIVTGIVCTKCLKELVDILNLLFLRGGK